MNKKLLNLEDTVGYLVDRAELASIGATLKGKVNNYDSLPEGTVGDVYAVGTTAPYSYYAYTDNGWLDIGTWPLAGPKGVPGDRGPQGPIGPMGPKGDKGNQGIAGPAGNGLGVNYITDLVLSKGSNTSISYNNTTGAALAKQGQIIAAGNTYDITVTDKIPIIPGDNIDISTNSSNNAIVISSNVPVTSVNGKTGAVVLKTSDLENNSNYITNSYHDNSKQDTLISGTNIKTINNQSILGSGNITISGGGGGGGSASDGFNNLKELILTPSTYVNGTPAGDFYFEGNGTFRLKDSSSATGIESIKVQLPVVPGDGVKFDKTTDGSCEISLKDFAMLDFGEFSTFPVSGTLTDEQVELIENHNYSFVKFSDSAGWHNNSRLYVYCSPVNEAPSYEGITYKSVTTEGNTYTVEIKIQRTTGGAFQSKSYSITKEATPTPGGGGGGGSASIYQHTITLQGTQYKYNITVVNSYQGSITSSSIWKEIYGTNKFTVPAIVTDSMDYTVSISSAYVSINPMNALSILFFPSNGTSQHSESISSSSTWEDNIISF